MPETTDVKVTVNADRLAEEMKSTGRVADPYPFSKDLWDRLHETGIVPEDIPVAFASIDVYPKEFVHLKLELVLTRDQMRALFDPPGT